VSVVAVAVTLVPEVSVPVVWVSDVTEVVVAVMVEEVSDPVVAVPVVTVVLVSVVVSRPTQMKRWELEGSDAEPAPSEKRSLSLVVLYTQLNDRSNPVRSCESDTEPRPT
jgi:hypothetical protein